MLKLLYSVQIRAIYRLVRNNSKQTPNAKGDYLMKYVCNTCGYIYDEAAGDPDNGIAPGTKWDDLPADFVCPLCGVGKEDFSPEG